MNRHTLLGFAVGIVVALIGYTLFIRYEHPSELPAATDNAATGTLLTNPNIKVSSPQPNALVQSPLLLTGSARSWYFEGSFPVELVDANKKVVIAGPANAVGDWMTSEFVPFKATLTWSVVPDTSTGTLIFKKDNPSGLPEHDESYSLPIRFR